MRRAALLVLVASCAIGAQVPSPVGERPATTISGVVYDSLSGRALSGALVQFSGVSDSLAGRQFAAQSDSAGLYVIKDVPPGRYLVAFFHAALDSLGLEAQSREIALPSESLRLDLATPSPRTLIAALCPPNADSSASNLLLGHVRSAATEAFVEGASATVVWTEWRLEAGTFREQTRTVRATSRANGAFAMCNLPDDVALVIRAGNGADSSGHVQFTLPAHAVQHLSLHLSDGSRLARLTGTVHDSLGRPLPNANVTVWESDRKARTNTNGAFVLDSLPSGTHTFEAIALGYTPFRAIVHLASERPSVTNATLRSRVTELATVTITATHERALAELERRLREFESHRARGGGHFVSAREIERRPGNTSMVRLIEGLPGLTVRCSAGGCDVAMTRASTYVQRGREGCPPAIYLDGRKTIFSASDLDLMLQARDIAAIEVYPRTTGRPIEFTEPFNNCGAIVVWTKPSLR